MAIVIAGYFGNQTHLRYLREVPIKDSKGYDLCLLFKMTVTYFFIPILLSRDGYVLGVVENRDRHAGVLWWSKKSFYPLTDADIGKWQSSGKLPTPLPQYRISFLDIWPLWMSWGVIIFVAICIILVPILSGVQMPVL